MSVRIRQRGFFKKQLKIFISLLILVLVIFMLLVFQHRAFLNSVKS